MIWDSHGKSKKLIVFWGVKQCSLGQRILKTCAKHWFKKETFQTYCKCSLQGCSKDFIVESIFWTTFSWSSSEQIMGTALFFVEPWFWTSMLCYLSWWWAQQGCSKAFFLEPKYQTSLQYSIDDGICKAVQNVDERNKRKRNTAHTPKVKQPLHLIKHMILDTTSWENTSSLYRNPFLFFSHKF